MARRVGLLEVRGEHALRRVCERPALEADRGPDVLVPDRACAAFFTSPAHPTRLKETLIES